LDCQNPEQVDYLGTTFISLLFPIQTERVKAFSVTLFGFRQKGAQAIGVHLVYLFATLDQRAFREYECRREERQLKEDRYFQNGFWTNSLFQAKDQPPYGNDEESGLNFIMNPSARI
jgi:fatty acid synthase subunit alpha